MPKRRPDCLSATARTFLNVWRCEDTPVEAVMRVRLDLSKCFRVLPAWDRANILFYLADLARDRIIEQARKEVELARIGDEDALGALYEID